MTDFFGLEGIFVTVGKQDESPASPAPITGPTFASAVLNGVGTAFCVSFTPPLPTLSAETDTGARGVFDGDDRRGRAVGAGDDDFRVLGLDEAGTASADVAVVVVEDTAFDRVTTPPLPLPDVDGATTSGASNSGGR